MPLDVKPSGLSQIETTTRDEILSHQRERLRSQLTTVATTSRFYARRFRAIGFDPNASSDIGDFSSIPVTTKEDLRRSIADGPPFGTFLAVHPDEIARLHFSSGTTGTPSPMCWTAADLEQWATIYARYLRAQKVGPQSRVQISYSFSWFVGGLGGIGAVERIGAMGIPAGSMDTARQLDVLERYGATDILCTPSFATHLAEVAEGQNIDLRSLPIAGLHLGGEPGAGVAESRRDLEARWGARCYDCYGSLEFQPIAWECDRQTGLHVPEDVILAEVVDPATKSAILPGHPGVLVLTHLSRSAMPLVRWWTGDIVRLTEEPCECGRTHARLMGGVLGRSDDMMIIRGVNVFPAAVAAVIRGIEGASGHLRIIKPSSSRAESLRLIVEAATTDVPAVELKTNIERIVKERLSVRPEVAIVAVGTLERATHKTQLFGGEAEWRLYAD